jgi:hypothetical protein
VTWFRRGRAAAAPPAGTPVPVAPPPQGDSPAELRATLTALVRFVNQSSGRLPGEAVVNIRRVTDTLGEVIDTSQVRPLDVYAVISVKATLIDYLPTTLRSYLALDPTLLNVARPSGGTPTRSLLEQIESLQSSADAVLVASRNQDADALMSQGNFLRTKFSRSDLDL